LSILPCPFGQGEKVKPPQSLGITGFLEMESSGLYLLLVIAGQNDRVELGAGGAIACSLAISTISQKVSADNVLDILLLDIFLDRVIDELRAWQILRSVGVSADKDIDALKVVSGAKIDIVLGLMLHPEHIPSLLARLANVADTDVYKSSLAPVAILDAKS
jgi:hypothetical protein